MVSTLFDFLIFSTRTFVNTLFTWPVRNEPSGFDCIIFNSVLFGSVRVLVREVSIIVKKLFKRL